MVNKKCSQCGYSLSRRNESGFCHSCAAKKMWQRPEHRLKTRASISAAWKDPEKRTRLMTPKSPEALARIAEAQRRPELRALHSRLSRGEKNYFYGKPGTNRGKFGKDHPMFGRKYKKKYDMHGLVNPFFGKHHKMETREKNSLTHLGKNTGPMNNLWRGGVSHKSYPPEFTHLLRKKIRTRDHRLCQVCHKPGYDVHHIFYNKFDNRPEVLITLCRSCHAKTNIDRKIWPPILIAKLIF